MVSKIYGSRRDEVEQWMLSFKKAARITAAIPLGQPLVGGATEVRDVCLCVCLPACLLSHNLFPNPHSHLIPLHSCCLPAAAGVATTPRWRARGPSGEHALRLSPLHGGVASTTGDHVALVTRTHARTPACTHSFTHSFTHSLTHLDVYAHARVCL